MMDLNWSHCLLVTLALMSSLVSGQSESSDFSKYAPKPGQFNRLESAPDKTIDQLITGALGGIDVASNKILAPGAYVLAELDMYLSQEQFLGLYEPPNSTTERAPMAPEDAVTSSRQKRKATRDVIRRWPGAEIPYQLARGDFTAKEEYMIRQSMTEWEKYTCVKFRPASAADSNVLRIQNGEGCNSQLGMVGGVQLLNLDVAGCRFKGLYLHEIGHALGLVHEHQLPDRDAYIDILLHNVAHHFRIFFNKYSPAVVNQFNVPYEYSSVMHYGVTAFSYNGQAKTIRTKDPSKETSIGKVYLKELSFSDVKVVNEMYSCSAECPDLVTCVDDGYLDQNCRCVCPDGTDSCEVKTVKTTPDQDGENTNTEEEKDEMDEKCQNKYESWKCAIWANQGECARNAPYMNKFCTRACGLCKKNKSKPAKNHFTTWAWQWFGMFTNLFPKDWMIGVCKDVYSFAKCYKWKQQGDCVTNQLWMEANCKATCNFCGNPVLRPETSCRNRNNNAECDKWAAESECILNAKWMEDKCPKSCRACTGSVTTDTQGDEDQDDTAEEEDDEVECRDKHDTAECARWARTGECSNNPTWMIPNCRKSCAKCNDGGCKNLYDDTQCRVWAQEKECVMNRVWMTTNCGKACGVCEDNSTNPDTGTGNKPDTDSGVVTTRRPYATTRRPYATTRRPYATTRRPYATTRRTNTRTTKQPDDGLCYNNHNDVECNNWADTGHCDINPIWMHAQCTKACGVCVTKDTAKEVCRDRDQGCEGWAKHGFCVTNPRYNLIYCKKSCNNCNGCRDEQFLCGVWAKAGHCASNARYMLTQCQRSCHTCE